MKNFVVVKFFNDEWFPIPSGWLHDENIKCHWPPGPTLKNSPRTVWNQMRLGAHGE